MAGYNNQLTHYDTAFLTEAAHQGRANNNWELDDVIDAPLAIITDIATSTYNSFVTENNQISTAEALNKIGANDAGDFYENNRTFVEVASFIGGLVAPGLIAAKAMRYARAGATSLTGGNKFQGFLGFAAKSKAKHSAHALQLVEAGQIATTEYAQARRAWALSAIGDAAMEGAAFEAAFVFMFNGHPFMDDYDPSDFVLGTAFGAAFVPFRYVLDARKYKLAAAEVEHRSAVASRIGVYPGQVGIAGTKGDQLSAMAENITNREQALKGEESLKGAALDLAERDQLKVNADLVDVATDMMDPAVKAESKAVQGGRKPAGEEQSFWNMSLLDRIVGVAKRTNLSFSGVRTFKLFDSATAPSREVAQASDMAYKLTDNADALRGSDSLAIEELDGGTIDSAFHFLNGGKRRLTADTVSNDALKTSGWDRWQDVFDVAEHEFDGTVVKLKRTSAGIDVETIDGDALWGLGSEFNDFMQDLLIHARADGVNIPVNMRVNWKDPSKFTTQKATMRDMHNTATGKSAEVSSFLTDEFRRGSFTPEMIAGTRALGARQVFAHLPGAEGAQHAGSFTGVRDMIDLASSGAEDFAVVELRSDARIATFTDLEQLSKEFFDNTKGLDLTAAGVATGPEAQKFLKSKGFSAMDVNLSSPDKRVYKNSGMVVFDGEGTIKRRLPADHTAAVRQHRIDNNLPDLTDEHAVLDPYSNKVIAASQAMLIQRAADLAGGYKFNRKYSMQGALEKVADFNPLEQATTVADSAFLDALHAVNRDKPKHLRVDSTDLPRMQAALIGGFADSLELVLPGGGAATMTQKTLTEALQRSKIAMTKQLTAKGYGMEQISAYTNLPLNTVESIVASGFNHAELVRGELKEIAGWMQYNSSNQDALASYLNPKQMLLEGDQAAMANLLKERQWSSIDSRLAHDLAQSTIGEISAQAASKVPIIGTLYDGLVNTPAMQALNKHADAFFSRTALGSVVISSRDFALRKLNELGTTDGADLGDLVVQMGEDFADSVNKYNTELLTSVNGSFAAIRRDVVATTQFNDVYRSLQKLTRDDQRNVVFDRNSGQFVLGRDKKTGEITNSLGYIRDGNFVDSKIIVNNKDLVDFYADVWPKVQDQLWNLQNTNRKMIGAAAPGRVGVWFPYNNISEANIAYVIDPLDVKKTRMIAAKNTGDLESQINRVKAELEPGHQIIRRGDTDEWNRITGYGQLNDIERADAGLKRSGILVEGTPGDDRLMQDVLDGMSGDVWKHSRQYMRLASGDLFQNLDRFTKFHKVPQISNAQNFNQKAAKKLSTSEVVAKTILNQDLLADSHLLNTVNNSYSYMIDKATDAVNATWATIRSTGVLGKSKPKMEWEKISRGMEEQGIPNPWKGWENFAADNPAWRRTDAKEKVARMNSVLATFNLRLWEVAHAAITTMTIPVVLAGELTKKDFPLRYMMNAAKRLVSKEDYWVKVRDTAALKGYSKGRAAEALTETLGEGLTDPSLWRKIEETKLMGMLTSPSDAAENLSRQLSYLTGYEVAISRFGKDVPSQMLETFANQFTNRTMGNYTARQRPTMFQGSLGATFGLYQTFMLTMFQNMFRFMEGANYNAMRNLMLAQTGMFGISSLPFFDPLSRAIGTYTNDDHADLTTTTYAMFGNDDDNSRSLAEYTLFGLPSTLFQSAFYTRGELQPRTPINPEGTPFTTGEVSFAPPIINTLKQLHDTAWQTGTRVATQLGAGGTPIDIGRAVAEGISIQSMWRPGARLSELITGSSFDRAGRVVSSEAEAQMNWATFARVMAVRPLKEQVGRNLNFLGKYYDAKDQAKRREAVTGMRSMVAHGDTTRLGPVFDSYLNNGGSASGWTSSVNEAYMAVATPYAAQVRNNVNKQPAIVAALNGYLG